MQRDEQGQGLIELIVSLMILAIAIGALLTVATSSAISLQRSDQKGTALMLAEQQIELYRNLTYPHVELDQASLNVIPNTDVYATAHASDPTIPSGPGSEVSDTSNNWCTPDYPNTPNSCNPSRIVLGPDHRNYRVDTYIVSYTPAAGASTIKQVTVVVRNQQIAGLPILARASSTFSPVDAASGKAQPKLVVAADAAATTSDTVTPTATLSGGSNPAGSIAWFVLGPQATAPSSCVSGTWQQVGGAQTVTGNGPYTDSAGFSPPSAGTYWWYATYNGDSGNNPVNSGCGASMTKTTVTNLQVVTHLHLTNVPANGTTGHAFTAAQLSAQLSTGNSPTGSINFYVSTSPGSSPSCPGGGVGWTLAGTATATGNGTYSPVSVSFTPTATGTYYWYAAYVGDANNAASDTCTDPASTTAVGLETFSVTINTTSPWQAGTPFSVTVQALLSGGATDTSYTDSRTIALSGPGNSPNGTALSWPATVNFTAGQATFNVTAYKAENTTLTVLDGTALIQGTSSSFTVNAGPLTTVTWSSISSQTAGSPFSATLSTTDSWGNPVSYNGSNKAVTITGAAASPGGNAATLPGTVSFVNGSGTFASSFTLFRAGSTTLSANVTGVGTGNSNSFTVQTAAGSKYAWTSIASSGTLSNPCYFTCTVSSAGNAKDVTPTLSVTDAYGNVVSGLGAGHTVTITITQNGSGGKFTAPSNTPLPITLTFPTSGAASVAFTYHTGGGSGWTDKISAVTASGTSYSTATLNATK